MNDILSLCEMSREEACRFLENGKCSFLFSSVYIGSEFCWEKNCSDYIWTSFIKNCHNAQIKVYFVFPIIQEKHIDSFRNTIKSLFFGGVDGFVVNDYGALYCIRKEFPLIPIIIGRLLVKSSRDYIKGEYDSTCRFPKEVIDIAHLYHCIRIDVDFNLFHEDLKRDLNIELGLHTISYLTSTMRCDYKIDKKRGWPSLNASCNKECLTELISVPETPLYKLGNALLFICGDYQGCADNVIHDCKLFTLI